MAGIVIYFTAMSVTTRSNCRFVLERSLEGKPLIALQLYQDLAALKGAKLGFELLGGTDVNQANKLIDQLNERILTVVVSSPESSGQL